MYNAKTEDGVDKLAATHRSTLQQFQEIVTIMVFVRVCVYHLYTGKRKKVENIFF